jgi:hypothetical protein
MKGLVVTSFSPDGERFYGRRMVKSFAKYWPKKFPLVVYADTPTMFARADVRLTSDITGWPELRASWQRDPAVHGCPHEAYPERDKAYSFIWDAARFAVKPFVMCDAAERMGTGILTWLDGDTVTTYPVEADFTERLLGEADVAYLGRRRLYPETGYLGFRLPEALPILRWCREAYLTGSFRALTTGWTDCHVFEAALKAVPNVTARNLTSGVKTEDSHIWAHSPLAPYMEHLKGRRRKDVWK